MNSQTNTTVVTTEMLKAALRAFRVPDELARSGRRVGRTAAAMSLALEAAMALLPRQAVPDGLAKDAFHDGVLLALQVLNSAGNGGDAQYMELLGCVDHRDLLARARQEDMLDLTDIEKWIAYGIEVDRLTANVAREALQESVA